MLRLKTWLCVVIGVLVCVGAGFVARPQASALTSLAQKPVVQASQDRSLAPVREALNAGGVCKYSAHTSVIIDSQKWTVTEYFCGTGFFAHEINGANDIYDNGGGPMWVKWYDGPVGHFCSISGQGAYWEFAKPVKITQISYGSTHDGSYCR